MLIADDRGDLPSDSCIPENLQQCKLFSSCSSEGYVCHRNDILGSGCCHVNANSARRYACQDCNVVTGCCKIYENCISCCMNPAKVGNSPVPFLQTMSPSNVAFRSLIQKPVLMGILSEARSLKNLLLLSVSDHFELCLALCRTSSSSVQHENIYIDPANKYCYTRRRKGAGAGVASSSSLNSGQQHHEQP